MGSHDRLPRPESAESIHLVLHEIRRQACELLGLSSLLRNAFLYICPKDPDETEHPNRRRVTSDTDQTRPAFFPVRRRDALAPAARAPHADTGPELSQLRGASAPCTSPPPV